MYFFIQVNIQLFKIEKWFTICIHFWGGIPKDVLEYVTEHINLSPLYNPYKEGSFILKWAIRKYQRRIGALDVVRGQRTMKEKEEDFEGRNILKSASNPVFPVNTPSSYRYNGETEDYDHYIPKWDITLDQLQVLYDKARFKRYLEWSTKSLGRRTNRRWFAWKKLCYSTAFKRRIPWLYPQNGKLFILPCDSTIILSVNPV